jgi:hypothetical protein
MVCSLAGAPQTAAVVADDDTFARIAEHRRLTALMDGVCCQTSKLEEELPEERRKAYMIAWGLRQLSSGQRGDGELSRRPTDNPAAAQSTPFFDLR